MAEMFTFVMLKSKKVDCVMLALSHNGHFAVTLLSCIRPRRDYVQTLREKMGIETIHLLGRGKASRLRSRCAGKSILSG
ncbi:hypothetical protein HGG82_09980 [Marinomonas sp. M1K-6]|uniref:Uncharacterized protein n=1 Tax=Marinomonas profundi TaxID=2726122 RepID=A0A847R783_9GAMM|nr:hypothetical protein [Marinomonas profundi]NLQ17956.1 hypothetical protein [Marinomonas profundi]